MPRPLTPSDPLILSQASYVDGDGEGVCRNCREVHYGVEPDARHYTCDTCGENEVYGMEELLLMGLLMLTEDEGDE